MFSLKGSFGLVAIVAVMGIYAWANFAPEAHAPSKRFSTPRAVPSRTIAASPTIDGGASIIDGDTLDIQGQRIRLHGIDAPEGRQVCQDGNGHDYRCGQRATRALADKIAGQPVSCDQRDVDRYGRIVGVCRAGGEDLNAWLVGEGWAVAYRRYSSDYVAMEDAARSAKRGLWSGRFLEPEQWRRQNG